MKMLRQAVIIISILAITTLSLPTLSFAEIPHSINYQGKLTDPSNSPVSDGTHSVTFRIYDVQAGGSPLWYETQYITTEKGLFSTQIGATKDLNLTFDKPYYLGIKVGTDTEMTPRQTFSSSAYAFCAKTLDGQKSSFYLNIPNFSIEDQAQGDIIYYNGTTWARLPAGKAGEVLKSGGAGGDLYWGSSSLNVEMFTTSDTWVKPTGVDKVWVECVGGGGGGAGSTMGNGPPGYFGDGGGGGSYTAKNCYVTGNVKVIVGS